MERADSTFRNYRCVFYYQYRLYTGCFWSPYSKAFFSTARLRRHAGRRGRPYANAVDALNAGRWSTGPAGLRASRIGETAITEAYKAGQLERARSAMAEYAADHARNPRVERLIWQASSSP